MIDYSKQQPLIEINKVLQGEGLYAGVPHFLIRLSGCNLNCFVDISGRGEARCIESATGKSIKIKDIIPGMKIMAFDEKTKQISETEVINTKHNSTKEWYEIKLENFSTINVTPDHPFLLTNNKWELAKNLKEGDVLQHIDGNERNSFRMKKNNPMKNKEIAKKTHSHKNYINSRISSGKKSGEKRKELGITWKTYLTEDEIIAVKKIQSEGMKGDKNPMKKLSVRIKSLKSRKFKLFNNQISKYEQKVLNIIKNLHLEKSIYYCGDGVDFYIANEKYKRLRIPDFFIPNKNKVIEVRSKEFYKNSYIDEVTSFYNDSGYEILVLNASDSDEIIQEKLLNYLHNGIKILTIKHRKNLISYKNGKHEVEYNTYNMHCEPYNNYLVKTSSSKSIISHNCMFSDSLCDTAYASWQPEKGNLTLGDLLVMVEANPQIKHAFITGGEPTIHPELVRDLTTLLHKNEIFVAIETNGTRFIENSGLDFITISPKLKNSVPVAGKTISNEYVTKKVATREDADKHEKNRKKYDQMKLWVNNFTTDNYDPSFEFKTSIYDFQFKFVITTEDELEEVKYIQELMGIPNDTIYLMPEGNVNEFLIKRRQWLMQICIREGYNYTDRLHILAYGNQRGM